MKTENLIALLLVIALILTVSVGLLYKEELVIVTPVAPVTPQTPEQPEPEPPKIPEVVPEFQNFPSLRNIKDLGVVLSDIEGHMPAGHMYSDPDKITWGHETTHGINSVLRMQLSRRVTSVDGKIEIDHVGAWLENIHGKKVFKSFAKINAFYVLEDRAVVIDEPNITVSDVAQIVPQSLRGDVYDLYMVRQARSWNDTPLYVLDELSSYTNGSAVRLDLGIKDRSETVLYMLEFNVYAICVGMASKSEDSQLKNYLKWNLKRSMKLYSDSKTELGGAEKHDIYLTTMRNAADAESFREFTRGYLGKEWTQKVLGF